MKITVGDFKAYLDLFHDDEEFSFHVCFTDSTDPEATQDWYPLELLEEEAPTIDLNFVFAKSCEKEIFEIFKKGLQE